ncbi:MAG TPA: TonB-dependent receptor [Labilithrix sp.]|nr:TonB-dependent receptor [Labilithrix sp.]
MKKSLLTALAFGTAMSLAAGIANAGDTSELEGLLNESVVSTASHTQETGSTAPATSVTVTAEELKLYGVINVFEALRYLSLGFTTIDAPHGSDIGVRGVALPFNVGRQVLWMLNGHVLNDSYLGQALFSLPIDVIDHIEVVLGPGSVLYGSNAMQAVVNVITKDTKSLSAPKVGLDAIDGPGLRLWAATGHDFELFGSRGTVVAGIQHFQWRVPDLEYPRVDFGIDRSTRAPYRFTSAPVGDGIWGGRATHQTRFNPSAVVTATLGDFRLGLQGDLSRQTHQIDPANFDEPGSRIITRAMRFDLQHRRQISRIVDVSERVYVDFNDNRTGIRTSRPPICTLRNGTCAVDAISESTLVGLELQGRFDWLGNGTFATLLGVNGSTRHARQQQDVLDASNDQPLILSSTLRRDLPIVGAYAQQTWDPLSWLGLNAGARLDYDERFPAVVSPREAIRFRPWAGSALKLIHSEAFRAPSIYESEFTVAVIPKPENLKPERVRSFEASFEQRLGAHRLLFGAFTTRYRDLIEFHAFTATEAAAFVASGRALIPPIFQHQNLSSVESNGFNGAVDGSLGVGRLKYALNLTSGVTRVTTAAEGTRPLAASPTLFGNAHVSYDLGRKLPTLGVVTSFYSQTPAVRPPGAATYYAPAQLDLRFVLAGPVPYVPQLSYRGYVSYSFAERTPAMFGPKVGDVTMPPILSPVDQLRLLLGVSYEF